jgi:hypothetical protein
MAATVARPACLEHGYALVDGVASRLRRTLRCGGPRRKGSAPRRASSGVAAEFENGIARNWRGADAIFELIPRPGWRCRKGGYL